MMAETGLILPPCPMRKDLVGQRVENRHEIPHRLPDFNLPDRMAFENVTPKITVEGPYK
ncbi:MAG: hypothetical protein WD063_18270 [Pirellulales bacterium]